MRHSLFAFATASVCSLWLCAACGNDVTSDDDDESGSSSGSTTTGSSGAVSQTDGGGSSSGGVVAAGSVVLSVNGTDYPLVLADLPHTTFKDTQVVTLPALWAASGVSASYNDFRFDFVGGDGFRPSTRDKCKTVVFDGATFAKGYVEVESQRLTWDDDLGFSGCAFVNGLARIEASAP